jgi:UDP-glucose 4-epimerase
MKSVVTGGAGCIGSELAERLLARGDEVTVIDNLSSGKYEHIAHLLNRPAFTFVEGDLLDVDAVDGVVRGVDIIYHLAANPDVKFTEGDATDKDLKQNTICTYNVLEAMRRHGVAKLAFSSTSAVYGVSDILPIPESAFFPRPISLYGATKLACEGLIGAFQNLFGFQCWIFRFANIVGPKVRKKGGTVIGDFIHRLQNDPTRLRILGNGRQAKSYLLSDECVDAILFAVDHATAPLNIFNLGSDDWMSVVEIADAVVQEMALSSVTYEFTGGEGGWPGDVPRFRLDVSAINKLGWKARHSSAEAVRLAIQSTLTRMDIHPQESRKQVVILAGGLGTRLQPITETIPKPMVPIAGKPYLEYQLNELRRQNCHDVILLTGYLGEQVEHYFGDGHRLGLSIRYSRETVPLGTGGAIREAGELLDDAFIVIYGDSYLPISYTDVLSKLRQSQADGIVVVYDNKAGDTSVQNNIAIDSEGYVTRYDKTDATELDYVEAGVLALRRSVLGLFPTAGPVSMEKELFPQLIRARRLLAYPTGQRFYDIGTPERLKTIEEFLTR